MCIESYLASLSYAASYEGLFSASFSLSTGEHCTCPKMAFCCPTSGIYTNLTTRVYLYCCFALAGMEQASETTEKKRSVVVQKTKICNYGQARYELANALSGVDGYDLTEDFKNAIRLLPSTYSASEYTQFLDDWGTVSSVSLYLDYKHANSKFWFSVALVTCQYFFLPCSTFLSLSLPALVS